MSSIHGSLTWLCQACTPNYCMTVRAPSGHRHRQSTSKVPTASDNQSTAPIDEIAERLAAMSVTQNETESTTDSPDQITQGEDYTPLPGVKAATATPEVSNPNQGEDCQLFLKGECPFGISGKRGGVCTAAHRKRCSRFLRWGNRSERGCKVVSCPKLHPIVCPASLDLVCNDQRCDFKIHTYKCNRKIPTSVKPKQTATKAGREQTQNKSQAGTSQRSKVARNPGVQSSVHVQPSPGCCAPRPTTTPSVQASACWQASLNRHGQSHAGAAPSQTCHSAYQGHHAAGPAHSLDQGVGFHQMTVQPVLEA